MTAFDAGDPTDSRTNGNADPFGVCFSHFDARMLESLTSSGNAIVDKDIHLFGFFVANVIRDIKVTDTATDTRRKFRDIKHIKVSDPTFSINYTLPGGLGTQTDR